MISSALHGNRSRISRLNPRVRSRESSSLRIGLTPFLLLGLLAGTAHAQSATDLRQGLADYPLPDPTALQALQDAVPMLLYPATVRNAVFSVHAVSSGGGTRTAAGVEVAPILIGNGIDLSKYLSGRLIRVLLRTRISVATSIGQRGGLRGALGLRWMLHDDADLRADSAYQRALVEWAEADRSIASACGMAAAAGSPEYTACLTETVSRQRSLQPRFDSLRASMMDRMWNNSVFELAVAAVYRQIDGFTSARGIAVQRYRLSLNCAFPMLGRSGQIVFGAGASVGREDDTRAYRRSGSLDARACYGGAAERVYLDAGLRTANAFLPDARLGIGAMIRIANGAWLQIGAGTSLLGREQAAPEGTVKLSFGTPEVRL